MWVKMIVRRLEGAGGWGDGGRMVFVRTLVSLAGWLLRNGSR
jgi:hypothetical protein